MNKINLVSIIFSLVCIQSLSAIDFKDPYFLSVKAKDGDGVITLLRRYKLHQYQDDANKFYDLNNLAVNGALFADREYKLPIQIYEYDGQSIRSTIGVNDWNNAIKIKEYNEEMLQNGLRSTHYSDSKILWVPLHMLNVTQENITPLEKSEIVEVSSKTISKSIFGKKYGDIEILDNSLENRVYYVVSGHGGPDPGTICDECTKTLCEDEYAYDVVLRLARNLLQHGAIVEIIIQDKNDGIRDGEYLKCDKDETLNNGKSLPLNQVARLNQRAFRVNELYKKYQKQGVKEQLMVAVHVDSRSQSHRQDVFFYHYPNSTSSQKLAQDVRDTFEEKYAHHQKNRDYKGYVDERNLHVLRVTQPKAIFIELANIKNTFDHKRILLSENRQALANWIFEGITKRVKKASNQVVASS